MIAMYASARAAAAKGGDLFIEVTHVGDDAANSRPEFAHYTMPPLGCCSRP